MKHDNFPATHQSNVPDWDWSMERKKLLLECLERCREPLLTFIATLTNRGIDGLKAKVLASFANDRET